MVVEQCDVHSLRREARLRPDAVRGEFVPRACEIGVGHPHPGEGTAPFALPAVRAGMDQRRLVTAIPGTILRRRDEIGRASCRERVCQYVEISGVAVSLKKKRQSKDTKTPT